MLLSRLELAAKRSEPRPQTCRRLDGDEPADDGPPDRIGKSVEHPVEADVVDTGMLEGTCHARKIGLCFDISRLLKLCSRQRASVRRVTGHKQDSQRGWPCHSVPRKETGHGAS